MQRLPPQLASIRQAGSFQVFMYLQTCEPNALQLCSRMCRFLAMGATHVILEELAASMSFHHLQPFHMVSLFD
jgi:hypothetical protein